MKMTLSMPRTISSTANVANAIHVSGLLSISTTGLSHARGKPLALPG